MSTEGDGMESGIRFELHINGERVCVAGMGPYGVLDAILAWVHRDPEGFDPATHPNSTLEEWTKEHLRIDVGGLSNSEVHLSWLGRTLKPGDEVRIVILPPGEVDPPKWIRPLFSKDLPQEDF